MDVCAIQAFRLFDIGATIVALQVDEIEPVDGQDRGYVLDGRNIALALGIVYGGAPGQPDLGTAAFLLQPVLPEFQPFGIQQTNCC